MGAREVRELIIVVLMSRGVNEADQASSWIAVQEFNFNDHDVHVYIANFDDHDMDM